MLFFVLFCFFIPKGHFSDTQQGLWKFRKTVEKRRTFGEYLITKKKKKKKKKRKKEEVKEKKMKKKREEDEELEKKQTNKQTKQKNTFEETTFRNYKNKLTKTSGPMTGLLTRGGGGHS